MRSTFRHYNACTYLIHLNFYARTLFVYFRGVCCYIDGRKTRLAASLKIDMQMACAHAHEQTHTCVLRVCRRSYAERFRTNQIKARDEDAMLANCYGFKSIGHRARIIHKPNDINRSMLRLVIQIGPAVIEIGVIYLWSFDHVRSGVLICCRSLEMINGHHSDCAVREQTNTNNATTHQPNDSRNLPAPNYLLDCLFILLVGSQLAGKRTRAWPLQVRLFVRLRIQLAYAAHNTRPRTHALCD